jgi:SAM-dependent methyltransferase
VKKDFPAGVKLEDKPCPLGCSDSDEFVLKGMDRIYGVPGEFTVVRCRTCGLMRTNPRPTLDTIGAYYPDNYGPHLDTRVKNITKKSPVHPLLRRIARKVFQMNATRLPAISPGRMLEIGCASGSFLRKMAIEGWDVKGIELSAKASENARSLGYSVHTGPIGTASEPERFFDLVVGWMVFEHLPDPLPSLRKLYSWTKPGGWLVLSVPDAGSLEFKIFRDYWYALHLPNHLYHYTSETIDAVLMRGGWRIERIFHHRLLNNLFPSIGYYLSDRGLKGRAVGWLINFPKNARMLHYFFYPISFLLGVFSQTGRMTVWARKVND